MNPVVPLLFAVGLLVGIRHRSRAGAGLLLATTTVMCGADFSEEPIPVDSVTVGVGGAAGGYREVCGPAHRYAGGAVSVEYRRTVARNLDLTGSLQVASAADTPIDTTAGSTRGGISVQPLVGFDHRNFGLFLGAHMGRLSTNINGNVMPSGRLRIGARDLFFVDTALADDFAGPLPGSVFRAGLGFGLPPVFEPGRWNHPVMRIGVATSGPYTAVEIGIGRQVRLDVFVGYASVETLRGAVALKWRPRLRQPVAPPLEVDMLPSL